MATSKRSTSKSGESSHEDVDTLTTSAVADPHSTAFAERQRDPNRYEDPTVATPGRLEDIDEDAGKPTALVDADAPSGLDPSVDNRDQVQPMLDTLADDAEENAAAQGTVTAAINAHASDAVDVEAEMEAQQAKREESRAALAASREESRATATAPATSDSKSSSTTTHTK